MPKLFKESVNQEDENVYFTPGSPLRGPPALQRGFSFQIANTEHAGPNSSGLVSPSSFTPQRPLTLGQLSGTKSPAQKQNRLDTRTDQLIRFYFKILTTLASDELNKYSYESLTKILEDSQLLHSVAGLAIEIQTFIMQETESDYQTILATCELDAFDVWKAMLSYDKATPTKPAILKNHLIQLELRSFLELFWRDEQSPLVDLIKKHIAQEPTRARIGQTQQIESFEGQNSAATAPKPTEDSGTKTMEMSRKNSVQSHDSNGPTLCHEVFFKRLLQLMADRIFKLCRKLELRENQMELTFELLKHIICEKIDLVMGRHLDQLMICCVYAVAIKTKYISSGDPKRFDEIITW